MSKTESSLLKIWKRCRDAVCNAASTVSENTKELLLDWKHAVAMTCASAVMLGGFWGVSVQKALAEIYTFQYTGNAFDPACCCCGPPQTVCTGGNVTATISVECPDLTFCGGSGYNFFKSITLSSNGYSLTRDEGHVDTVYTNNSMEIYNGKVDWWIIGATETSDCPINSMATMETEEVISIATRYGSLDELDGVVIQSCNDNMQRQGCVRNPGTWTLITPPPQQLANPKNTGEPEYCPAPTPLAGNPINTATGNKLQIETDYTGAANTHLELRRVHNSQDTASSPFGANWRSTWHRALGQPDANTVKVTREDGRVDTFTQKGAAWASDPDVTSRLSGSATGDWQLVRDDDSTETYAPDGRLLSVTTRAGLVTMLSYDGNNRLTSVTGPFGHAMSFANDGNGFVSGVTLPDGGQISYAYDASNNFIAVVYPDESVRQYLYENTAFPHVMTGIVDEKRARFATYVYDDKGRAVSTEHTGGADKTVVTYNADGSAKVTDARGNTRDYSFTTQFDLVKPIAMSPGCCGGADYTYDDKGFLASRTDFNGNVTTYVHNARGLETSRIEAKGTAQERAVRTQWHSIYHLPTKITEPGRVTDFTYDAKGNLLKKTVTAGTETRSWAYIYNDKGQVLTIDGSRTDVNDVTSFTYDAKGNMTSIKNALGHVTKITSYDADGRPLTVQDPNGFMATLAYDARGRLTSHAEGTETTSYGYDSTGNLTRVTLPDGSFLTYDYDAAHRLTGIGDTRGNRIVYTLDGNGNRTKEEVFDAGNTLARTLFHTYDALNRLASDIGTQGQTTAYTRDANGNVTAETDPLGNKTAAAYDALNRLIRQTDPNGSVTRFAYTRQDEIAVVTDPRNLKTRYTRNGFDDVTSIASPDTGKTVNTYDTAGNVITSTDAKGQETAYQYDALNRLTQTTYADGKTVTFQYDQGINGIGHLTKVIDAMGSTTFQHDQHGREILREQKTGAITLTTARTYDTSGRPETVTYPSGKRVTVVYDMASKLPSGILVDGKQLIANIDYRPFGPVAGWTIGRGVAAHDRFFDADGRLEGINAKADTLRMTYDDAGRITEFDDSLFPGKVFTYDKGGRLVSEEAGSAMRSYGYDKNGNRTAYDMDDSHFDYAYVLRRNWLTLLTGEGVKQRFKQDETGNMILSASRQFTYGADGRLAQAAKGKVTATYAYNGLGQRVKKDVGGTVTLFVTDDNGQLLGEYNAAGKAVQETVYLDGQPIGVMKGAQLYTVNPDHLGAPRTILNQSGQIVWQWNRDAFGNGAPNQKPGAAAAFPYNLRLPGQYFDKETGLFFNNARYYDPTLGRYIEPDPIGLAGGINPYVYVVNNPVNNIDPTGLVYYCSAPLHALPSWFLGGVGPTHHSFLCDNSRTICGGQDRKGSALYSDGQKSQGDMYNLKYCKELSDSPCVDSCVIDAIENPGRPKYTIVPSGSITVGKTVVVPSNSDLLSILGLSIPQNCQSWAKNTYTRCLLRCSLGEQ